MAIDDVNAALRHRLSGHRIRLRNERGSARIVCETCKVEIVNGPYLVMDEIFESVMMFERPWGTE